MSGLPFVCVFGSVLYFFRGGIQAEANNCPVDVAALHLDGGTTCASHKATQVFLEGFMKHLDDSGLQLDPSKCEHFLAKPCLPPFIRWRSRWRGQFANDKCFALQGSRHGSSICCPGRPPSFSIGCASASVTPATTRAIPPDTLYIRAQRTRTSLKKCLEESPRSPSLKCRGVACPTPRGFHSLQQQHGSPLVVATGDQFCCSIHDAAWLPGVRHATSVTCQNAHTLDTLMPQASQEDQTSIKLRQVPGAEPGQWRARLLLFECDADLIRTALQHRLCTHFLAQDTQCLVCGQVLDCFLCSCVPMRGPRERQTQRGGPRLLRQASALKKKSRGSPVTPSHRRTSPVAQPRTSRPRVSRGFRGHLLPPGVPRPWSGDDYDTEPGRVRDSIDRSTTLPTFSLQWCAVDMLEREGARHAPWSPQHYVPPYTQRQHSRTGSVHLIVTPA